MEQDYTISEWAERAAEGRLTESELQALELRKAASAAFAQEYDEMYHLIAGLNAAGRSRRYRGLLNEIGKAGTARRKKPLTKIISLPMWRTAAVAASVALLTSTITLWTMRHGEPEPKQFGIALQQVRRDVRDLKQRAQATENKVDEIKGQKDATAAPILPSYSGTGFALTNDGYLITAFHVTEGADSLYVQLRNGHNYKAHVVATEPGTDVAVLKIDADNFRFGKSDLPYTFATGKASLGSRIFSLGFPQDEVVYNEGYIAARNGYAGDSAQYRLEIAAAPGQSGSPVADEQGNIVAIIKSRDSLAMGTTYAVSSRTLLRLLKDLPKSMKLNLPKSNHLASYSRAQQIETLQDYTCVVKVYGK